MLLKIINKNKNHKIISKIITVCRQYLKDKLVYIFKKCFLYFLVIKYNFKLTLFLYHKKKHTFSSDVSIVRLRFSLCILQANLKVIHNNKSCATEPEMQTNRRAEFNLTSTKWVLCEPDFLFRLMRLCTSGRLFSPMCTILNMWA